MDYKELRNGDGDVLSAPNGNGGVYAALRKSGILAELETNGVRYVFQYCVDNVLVRMADPLLIGFAEHTNSDCTSKFAVKRSADEKGMWQCFSQCIVGVFCLRAGRPTVLEYSELSPELANLRTENGDLVYGAAHLCMNVFRLDFLQRASKLSLMHHIAKKTISVDGKMTQCKKAEMFLFDAFAFAERFYAVEVDRSREFSPIKNAVGEDSPETALSDLLRNL